jgi:hypothetical protein
MAVASSLTLPVDVPAATLSPEIASALKTDAEVRPEHPAIPRLDHWGLTLTVSSRTRCDFSNASMTDAHELRRLARHLKDMKDVKEG